MQFTPADHFACSVWNINEHFGTLLIKQTFDLIATATEYFIHTIGFYADSI